MAIARSTDQQFVTAIDVGGHTIVSDTTWRDLGGESAPSPHQLLDSSLAACIAMTVRIAADARGTALDWVSVDVSHVEDDDGATFTCTVELHGELSERERAGLLRVAEHCPVSKLLKKDVSVVVEAG